MRITNSNLCCTLHCNLLQLVIIRQTLQIRSIRFCLSIHIPIPRITQPELIDHTKNPARLLLLILHRHQNLCRILCLSICTLFGKCHATIFFQISYNRLLIINTCGYTPHLIISVNIDHHRKCNTATLTSCKHIIPHIIMYRSLCRVRKSSNITSICIFKLRNFCSAMPFKLCRNYIHTGIIIASLTDSPDASLTKLASRLEKNQQLRFPLRRSRHRPVINRRICIRPIRHLTLLRKRRILCRLHLHRPRHHAKQHRHHQHTSQHTSKYPSYTSLFSLKHLNSPFFSPRLPSRQNYYYIPTITSIL